MGNTDWLIIGGGIHGVHIAARLVGEGGVAPQRVCIVDPAERLLERWRACTATTGMAYLRSPTVHHVGLSPWSLRRFAGRRHPPGLFAPPYDRPALALFNAHCEHVITRYELRERHVRGRVTACAVDGDGVRVRLGDGRELAARRAVLAIGASEQPLWPQWAPRDHDRVHHVFAPGFDGWPSEQPEEVAVIGGGITAGQVSLRLAREGHRVHMVSRHAPRQHQFDSDPGWLGPRHMTSFHRERDHDRRRAMIVGARHRGSVPPDLRRALRRAVRDGAIRWREAEVRDAIADQKGARLRLETGDALEVDRVLLATGFTARRPGGAMIDELVASESLPRARCGYPIVDAALRWHPKIHVTGPLAELELGPTSRNIAGARKAGDRLIDALHQGAVC